MSVSNPHLGRNFSDEVQGFSSPTFKVKIGKRQVDEL